MKWDPTISAGTLVALAGFAAMLVGGWFAFRQWATVKLVEMQITLNNHADQLQSAAIEIREQRAAQTALIGQVQRLVGQIDMLIRGQGRHA